MILQETIDKIFALDIVDVIMNEGVNLKKQGSNYAGLSPFTNEKTPSFMVSPVKQIFKCFSSGKGGNLVTFIMEKESLSYPEALRYLANKNSIPIIETEKTDEEKKLELEKESIYLLNLAVTEQYQEQLKTYPGALDYITNKRNIPLHILEKFNIGFAPPNNSISSFILSKGYNWKIGVEAAIIGYKDNKIYDKFMNRIIFPIKNHTGRCTGFGGRYIGNKENQPKYINTANTIVYNKSEILYGLYEGRKAITEHNKALWAEGYLDVVSLHKIEVENVISSSGIAITEEQCSLLKRYTKNVTIIFDSDKSGIKSAFRNIDVLLKSGMKVKVCILPEGEDPDSFSNKKTKEQFLDYILVNEKDFIMFKLEFLLKDNENDLSKRSEAINDVLNSISKITDGIAREVYLKEISRILDMNTNSLREMVKFEHTKEEAITGEVRVLENNIDLNRILIKEKCERKIVQLLISYGTERFNFTEHIVDGNGKYCINVVQKEVKEKVKQTIIDEEIEFSNPSYNFILKKAIETDLSDFNNLKVVLSDELFLLAEELKNEELESITNTFSNRSEQINETIKNNISKTIEETLIYYTSIYAMDLVDEEFKKDVPDFAMIQEYIQFSVKLKKLLNLV